MGTLHGLKSDETERRIEAPTTYATRANSYRLHCAECGDLYYVDLPTFEKATSALEGDASEIRFCCGECEQERAEEEYTHSMC